MKRRQRIKAASAALLVALTISMAALAVASFAHTSVAVAAPCWRCSEFRPYDKVGPDLAAAAQPSPLLIQGFAV